MKYKTKTAFVEIATKILKYKLRETISRFSQAKLVS